jgi:hypothetical protein
MKYNHRLTILLMIVAVSGSTVNKLWLLALNNLRKSIGYDTSMATGLNILTQYLDCLRNRELN